MAHRKPRHRNPSVSRSAPQPVPAAAPRPTPAAAPKPAPAAAPASPAAASRDRVTGGVWLYGVHAVAAAIANPKRRIYRLLVTNDGHAALEQALGGRPALSFELVERGDIARALPAGAVHQGIAAYGEALQSPALEDLIAAAGPEAVIVVLDQVTDPHNVGAIVRTAAAFNAAGVVLPRDHAPPESGAMAKAASGALDRVKIARVTNLARALRALAEAGFWVIGLDAGADRELAAVKPAQGRVALVLGGEGRGLRRLTRETCDELARLPMTSAVESLNVSNAAAVALYELRRNAG